MTKRRNAAILLVASTMILTVLGSALLGAGGNALHTRSKSRSNTATSTMTLRAKAYILHMQPIIDPVIASWVNVASGITPCVVHYDFTTADGLFVTGMYANPRGCSEYSYYVRLDVVYNARNPVMNRLALDEGEFYYEVSAEGGIAMLVTGIVMLLTAIAIAGFVIYNNAITTTTTNHIVPVVVGGGGGGAATGIV
jgi:hypothetical protein